MRYESFMEQLQSLALPCLANRRSVVSIERVCYEVPRISDPQIVVSYFQACEYSYGICLVY